MLAEGENVIGRDPSCSIWLDDPDVSRRHARIRIDSLRGSATLEDLKSTNGTSIRRSPVKGQIALVNGNVIRVGPLNSSSEAKNAKNTTYSTQVSDLTTNSTSLKPAKQAKAAKK